MKMMRVLPFFLTAFVAVSPISAFADECALYSVFDPDQIRKGLTVSVGLFGVDGAPKDGVGNIETLRAFAAEAFREELEKANYFKSVQVVSDEAAAPTADLRVEAVISGLEAAGSRWLRATLGRGGAKARLNGVVRRQSRDVILDFECEGSEVGGPVNLGGWVAALQSGEGRMRKNFENFASDFAKSIKDLDKELQDRNRNKTKRRAASEGGTERKGKEWRKRVIDSWTPEEHSKEVATFIVQTENQDWFRVHALWLARSAYRSNAYLNAFEFENSERKLEDGLLPDLQPLEKLVAQPVYLIGVTFESGASDGSTDGDEPPFFIDEGSMVAATRLTRLGSPSSRVGSVGTVGLRPYLQRRGKFKVRWRNVPMVFAFPMTAADGAPLIQSLNDEIELRSDLAGHEVVVRFRLSDFDLADLAELLPRSP